MSKNKKKKAKKTKKSKKSKKARPSEKETKTTANEDKRNYGCYPICTTNLKTIRMSLPSSKYKSCHMVTVDGTLLVRIDESG